MLALQLHPTSTKRFAYESTGTCACGGDGGQDGGQDVGGGKEKKDTKGKGKYKSSTGKGDGKVGVKENSQPQIKKEDGNKTTGNANEENRGAGGGAKNAVALSTAATSEKPEGAGGGTSEELLQEATKILKSCHLPSVKSISLQEVGDVTQNQEGKMNAVRQWGDTCVEKGSNMVGAGGGDSYSSCTCSGYHFETAPQTMKQWNYDPG